MGFNLLQVFGSKSGAPAREWMDDPARIRAILDRLPANVFIADRELKLIYANETAKRSLGAFAEVVQKLFGVAPDQIVGGSIHRFHKEPGRIEAILRDTSRLPHAAVFSFGDVTLKTTIDAIRGPDGVEGYMVCWENVSQMRKLEKRVSDGVTTMLDDITAVAAGDLRRKITVTGDDDLGRMGDGLGRLIGELARSIGQMSDNAQTLAAASEEMRASAEEISRNTTEAEKVAADALNAAEGTGAVIKRLDHASQEIGKVTRLISSIAEQTNLLALNATIEAARAGEVGKGFAVVAGEVKDLAKETASATTTIGQRVEEIQRETAAAVKAVSEIMSTTHAIHDRQAAIAGALVEQTSTSGELAHIAATLREISSRFRT